MLSVSICRMILVRWAPIAIRSEVSARRPIPRTSTRFAMFAHAISSTSAQIPISKYSPFEYCCCIFAMPTPPGVSTTCDRARLAFRSVFAYVSM